MPHIDGSRVGLGVRKAALQKNFDANTHTHICIYTHKYIHLHLSTEIYIHLYICRTSTARVLGLEAARQRSKRTSAASESQERAAAFIADAQEKPSGVSPR